MSYRCLYFLLITFSITIQAYSQKPIQLKEVLIEHSNKKPKIKKFKFSGGTNIINYDLFFNYEDAYSLTDSLPIGYIQEMTIYFSQLSKQIRLEDWKHGSFKLNKTEFEVTIYEVNDDYTVGNKVNAVPIHITLEESKKASIFKTQKVKLNLTPYNFQASRFFVGIKKVTDTACDDCYYYAPELHKTGDKKDYIIFKDKTGRKKQYNWNGYMLKSEVKTLTSYY